MIEIAVCDDERPSLERSSEQARSSAARLHLQADVVPYTRSDALLYDIIEDGAHFDLLLLDIEMPNVDGMDLAAQIKPHLPDAKIIFITSHAEYAIDAFELSVFRYVPKSDINQRLPRALDDALRIIAVDADRAFAFERAGRMERIAYRAMDYIDRSGKDCVIHHAGSESRVRMSLQELVCALDSDEFIFIDRGIVVNLTKVKRVRGQSALLLDGTELPISRGRLKETKRALAVFWGSKL